MIAGNKNVLNMGKHHLGRGAERQIHSIIHSYIEYLCITFCWNKNWSCSLPPFRLLSCLCLKQSLRLLEGERKQRRSIIMC